MAQYLKSHKYLSARQRGDIFARRCEKRKMPREFSLSATDVKEAG
jgi:hypothetical protein